MFFLDGIYTIEQIIQIGWILLWIAQNQMCYQSYFTLAAKNTFKDVALLRLNINVLVEFIIKNVVYYLQTLREKAI